MSLSRLCSVMCVCLGALISGQALADEYLLGPQDRLKVRVYDLRTGQAHEWTGLVGEFTVNAKGMVSFPIVGELRAAGYDTAHLATELGLRLGERVGLSQAPVASVEVFEYRPFYITGTVGKPGEYKYRPGLTVLQAVSLAGGLSRPSTSTLMSLKRDVVSADGELSTMKVEQSRLEVRLARLQAAISNAAAFDYPTDASSDATLVKAVRDERLLFETYVHTKDAQVSGARQTKAFLTQEIANLSEKDASLSHRLQLVQRELDNVNALFQRGLAVSSRQTGLEETRAQLESSRLDVQLAIARARQDTIRADRELAEVTEKTRAQILTETSEARLKLATIEAKMRATQVLAFQAQENLELAGHLDQPHPRYQLIRKDEAGRTLVSQAKEDDTVLVGDTLKVDLLSAAGARIGVVDAEQSEK